MPVLMALVILAAFFSHATYGVMKKRGESERHVRLLREETIAMNEKREDLANGLQGLNTSEGIEKEVKEKFNVSREGEHVVILVDSPAPPAAEKDSDQPWYKRLWSAIISENQ